MCVHARHHKGLQIVIALRDFLVAYMKFTSGYNGAHMNWLSLHFATHQL